MIEDLLCLVAVRCFPDGAQFFHEVVHVLVRFLGGFDERFAAEEFFFVGRPREAEFFADGLAVFVLWMQQQVAVALEDFEGEQAQEVFAAERAVAVRAEMRQAAVVTVFLRRTEHAEVKVGRAAAEVEDAVIGIMLAVGLEAERFQRGGGVGGRLARALAHGKFFHGRLIRQKRGRQRFPDAALEAAADALAHVDLVRDGERHEVAEEDAPFAEHIVEVQADVVGVDFDGVEVGLGELEEAGEVEDVAFLVADLDALVFRAAPMLQVLEERCVLLAGAVRVEVLLRGAGDGERLPARLGPAVAGAVGGEERGDVEEMDDGRVLVVFEVDALTVRAAADLERQVDAGLALVGNDGALRAEVDGDKRGFHVRCRIARPELRRAERGHAAVLARLRRRIPKIPMPALLRGQEVRIVGIQRRAALIAVQQTVAETRDERVISRQLRHLENRLRIEVHKIIRFALAQVGDDLVLVEDDVVVLQDQQVAVRFRQLQRFCIHLDLILRSEKSIVRAQVVLQPEQQSLIAADGLAVDAVQMDERDDRIPCVIFCIKVFDSAVTHIQIIFFEPVRILAEDGSPCFVICDIITAVYGEGIPYLSCCRILRAAPGKLQYGRELIFVKGALLAIDFHLVIPHVPRRREFRHDRHQARCMNTILHLQIRNGNAGLPFQPFLHIQGLLQPIQLVFQPLHRRLRFPLEQRFAKAFEHLLADGEFFDSFRFCHHVSLHFDETLLHEFSGLLIPVALEAHGADGALLAALRRFLHVVRLEALADADVLHGEERRRTARIDERKALLDETGERGNRFRFQIAMDDLMHRVVPEIHEDVLLAEPHEQRDGIRAVADKRMQALVEVVGNLIIQADNFLRCGIIRFVMLASILGPRLRLVRIIELPRCLRVQTLHQRIHVVRMTLRLIAVRLRFAQRVLCALQRSLIALQCIMLRYVFFLCFFEFRCMSVFRFFELFFVSLLCFFELFLKFFFCFRFFPFAFFASFLELFALFVAAKAVGVEKPALQLGAMLLHVLGNVIVEDVRQFFRQFLQNFLHDCLAFFLLAHPGHHPFSMHAAASGKSRLRRCRNFSVNTFRAFSSRRSVSL